MKRLYVDTNIFLHYRYDDIDWCALAATDAVVLVVVAEVYREIEKHKDQSRDRVQRRARAASSWIAKVLRDQGGIVRPGIRLELAIKDPTNADVAALGLSPDVSDDRILTAILKDAQAGLLDAAFVTADNLRMFKAEAHGLRVLPVSDDQKLADEPDPREEEIRKLRQKLDERPKLALAFEGQASHLTASLLVFEEFSEAGLNAVIDEERSCLDDSLSAAMRAALYEPPGEQEKKRYLEKFRQWLRDHYDDLARSRLTVSLNLDLRNDGRGTANDIEVLVTVPPPVLLVQPSPVELSTPPARPKWRSRLDLLGNFRLLEQMEERIGKGIVPLADMLAAQNHYAAISYDDSNPQTARLDLRSLKHTSVHRVSLPAWFPDAETALATTGFAISYRIHAAFPPDIEEGELHVRLDAKRVPLSTFHIRRDEG
jgi:hypothetical protein